MTSSSIDPNGQLGDVEQVSEIDRNKHTRKQKKISRNKQQQEESNESIENIINSTVSNPLLPSRFYPPTYIQVIQEDIKNRTNERVLH